MASAEGIIPGLNASITTSQGTNPAWYPSNFMGPIPNGSQRIPNQGVLGASTSTGGGSKAASPAPGPAPAAQDQGPNLDDVFNPVFSALGDQENNVRSGYSSDVGNVNNQYGSGVDKTNKEQGTLLGGIDQNQSDFEKSVSSALAQAVQYYNALAQRGRSAYGAFSSAGQALSDIGTQEFARQQGNLNTELTKGITQFNANRQKVRDYITGKLSDLDNWKTEALGSLKKNLDASLSQINSQRNQANSDKAAARLDAIQQTMANARQIASNDSSYRQSLMQQEVGSLEQTLGRTLTVEEKALLANDYGISIANIAQNIQGNPGSTITSQQGQLQTPKYQDPYSDLQSTPSSVAPASTIGKGVNYLA